MRKLRWIGLGAALTYFFDPEQGRRRRAMTRDRIAAMFRRASTYSSMPRVSGSLTMCGPASGV